MKRKLNRVKGMSRVLPAAVFTALIAASGSFSGLRHETAPLPTSINPAIGIYSDGLSKFPVSCRLYRHRGHRYISIRQFGRAIADFEKAAALVRGKPLEVEPDGVPNKTGTPVSNTQFNIYYHLGLAYFLTRDFTKAEAAYRECLRWSKNDDPAAPDG
jgi:tetratricopeptide (TPR) repeat protein